MSLIENLRGLASLRKGRDQSVIESGLDMTVDTERKSDRSDRIEAKDPFYDWDGRSVRSLPMDVVARDPSAVSVPALVQTVPEAYRQAAFGPKVDDGVGGENSLWSVQNIFSVAAVDKEDQALVVETRLWEYTDAESHRVMIMPKDQAFDRHDALEAEARRHVEVEKELFGVAAQAGSMPRPEAPVPMKGPAGGESELLESPAIHRSTFER